MSNRQINAWGDLIATLTIWGAYFVRLGQAVASGELAEAGFAETMGVHLGLSLLLSILSALVIGFMVNLVRHHEPTRREAEDEAWAGLRATRVAHAVVIVLIMALTGLALALGAFAGPGLAAEINALLGRSVANGLVLFANAGIAVLVLAELVHYGALIVFLRRGRQA